MSDIQMDFPDDLSHFDYLLYRGESNPITRSCLLSVITLETSPDFAELTRVVERASRIFIRLRQKVVEPSKSYVAARWVIDPDFDMSYHLRRVRIASPGDQEELLTLANQLNATPFDVRRPLWEFTVVDGLEMEGSKAAIIFKLHHSVTDGVGAMALLQQLLEIEPNAPAREMPLRPVPEDIDPEEVTKLGKRKALGRLLPTTRNNIGLGLKFINSTFNKPMDVISDAVNYGKSVKRVFGSSSLHNSPLLSGRSLSRDFGVIEVPLDKLKNGTKAANGSINDGFLAAVSIGLHKYHKDNMVGIEQLSISMPVNIRSSNAATGGNHFVGARVNLPINETEPSACIDKISQAVDRAKTEPAALLLNHLMPVLSALPNDTALDISTKVVLPDIQLSNVQGYSAATYLAGCKITKLLPFGPVPGVATMITMVSYNGTCFLGIHADSAAIKDFELFINCIQSGFDEVMNIGASTPIKAPIKTPTKKKAVNVKKTRKKTDQVASTKPLKASAKKPTKTGAKKS